MVSLYTRRHLARYRLLDNRSIQRSFLEDLDHFIVSIFVSNCLSIGLTVFVTGGTVRMTLIMTIRISSQLTVIINIYVTF